MTVPLGPALRPGAPADAAQHLSPARWDLHAPRRQPEGVGLREHLGELASGPEVSPEISRGRDPLGCLCHPVGDKPLDTSAAERLHQLGLRGGRPHRRLRVHVVGERVHEGTA